MCENPNIFSKKLIGNFFSFAFENIYFIEKCVFGIHGVVVRALGLCYRGFRFESLSALQNWVLRKIVSTSAVIVSREKRNWRKQM